LIVCGQWGTFYLFIANFFATQIIGGAKELVAWARGGTCPLGLPK